MNVERAARSPSMYAVMVHNVAFSYSTVTQDITYHNAEINAAGEGTTMTDKGLRMEGTVPTKSFCQFSHAINRLDRYPPTKTSAGSDDLENFINVPQISLACKY